MCCERRRSPHSRGRRLGARSRAARVHRLGPRHVGHGCSTILIPSVDDSVTVAPFGSPNPSCRHASYDCLNGRSVTTDPCGPFLTAVGGLGGGLPPEAVAGDGRGHAVLDVGGQRGGPRHLPRVPGLWSPSTAPGYSPSWGEHGAHVLDLVFSAVSDPDACGVDISSACQLDARVTDLARGFPISLYSTSKHIRVLEDAGLVRRSVRGREHPWTLDAAPLAEAAGWIARYQAFWSEQLASLTRLCHPPRARQGGRRDGRVRGHGPAVHCRPCRRALRCMAGRTKPWDVVPAGRGSRDSCRNGSSGRWDVPHRHGP